MIPMGNSYFKRCPDADTPAFIAVTAADTKSLKRLQKSVLIEIASVPTLEKYPWKKRDRSTHTRKTMGERAVGGKINRSARNPRHKAYTEAFFTSVNAQRAHTKQSRMSAVGSCGFLPEKNGITEEARRKQTRAKTERNI